MRKLGYATTPRLNFADKQDRNLVASISLLGTGFSNPIVGHFYATGNSETLPTT